MGDEQSPETKFALHELRISRIEEWQTDVRKTREAERWWVITTLVIALISIAVQIAPHILKGIGK